MFNRFILIAVLFFTLFSCVEKSSSPQSEIDNIAVSEEISDSLFINDSPLSGYLDSLGFVDIKKMVPSILVDLKYATTGNFTGKILYDNLAKAYLHPLAVSKLQKAHSLLKEEHPHLNLLIYDAARPLSVQKKMFDAVKGTKYSAYVANPSRTGLHNYGMAVDLSLCNNKGEALDMGTDFDYFGAKAGINNEASFLTAQQLANRRLLRSVMQRADFIPIRGEWWHFNACSLSEAKKTATLIE